MVQLIEDHVMDGRSFLAALTGGLLVAPLN
jgi:hypothetical protein